MTRPVSFIIYCTVLLTAAGFAVPAAGSVYVAQRPVSPGGWLPRGGAPAALLDRRIRLARVVDLPELFAAPATAPAEADLWHDLADGRLDEFQLLDAALIASGVLDPAHRNACRLQIEATVDRLASTGRVKGELPDRARAVFESLHGELLTGVYRADCTSPEETLRTGDYNCVAATILYHALARRFELPLSAVQSPGHIHSRLLTQPPRDIQDTYADWFSPSPRPRFDGTSPAVPILAANAALADGRPTTSAHAPTGRVLNDAELVAKVYYNLGVEHLEAGRFAEATRANAVSRRLDPADASAYGNLLAGINNWALHLARQGKFAAAADLLQQGMQLDPAYGPFAANEIHVHQRWIAALCDAGEFAGALEVADRACRRRPDVELFQTDRQMILEREAASK